MELGLDLDNGLKVFIRAQRGLSFRVAGSLGVLGYG